MHGLSFALQPRVMTGQACHQSCIVHNYSIQYWLLFATCEQRALSVIAGSTEVHQLPCLLQAYKCILLYNDGISFKKYLKRKKNVACSAKIESWRAYKVLLQVEALIHVPMQ